MPNITAGYGRFTELHHTFTNCLLRSVQLKNQSLQSISVSQSKYLLFFMQFSHMLPKVIEPLSYLKTFNFNANENYVD